MRLQMGYPEAADEMEILRAPRLAYDAIALNPVATRSDILKMQALAGKVFVEETVLDYILKIVAATRTEAEKTPSPGSLAMPRATARANRASARCLSATRKSWPPRKC